MCCTLHQLTPKLTGNVVVERDSTGAIWSERDQLVDGLEAVHAVWYVVWYYCSYCISEQ